MTTKKIELGRMNGIPEVRIHHFHTEHRHTIHKAYAIIDADISDDAWNAVKNCAVTAGAGAVLAAIFSVGAGAFAAFWATFSTCITASGIDIAADSVKITVETTHGEWHDWTPI